MSLTWWKGLRRWSEQSLSLFILTRNATLDESFSLFSRVLSIVLCPIRRQVIQSFSSAVNLYVQLRLEGHVALLLMHLPRDSLVNTISFLFVCHDRESVISQNSDSDRNVHDDCFDSFRARRWNLVLGDRGTFSGDPVRMLIFTRHAFSS